MSLIDEYRRGRDLGICHQRFETTFKISTPFSHHFKYISRKISIIRNQKMNARTLSLTSFLFSMDQVRLAPRDLAI